MCQETHFDYDKCEHFAPRPARTTKCALAKRDQECHTKQVLMKLSSKTECPECLGYRRLIRLAKERNLNMDDMDDDGHWKKNDVSMMAIVREAYAEDNQTQTQTPVPAPTPAAEEPVKKSFLTRCCTWPSSDHRAEGPPKPEEIEWQIPTKCFIDIGFVRLDPWAADREKLRMEAERKREQQRLEQRCETGRRASLPDLQQIFQDCLASRMFTRPEPIVKVGSCCMEKKRRMEARGTDVDREETGRDHASRENRNIDDWCTSKF